MQNQPKFAVKSEPRLDSKWLSRDLQCVFSYEGLAQSWNELVKEGELQAVSDDTLSPARERVGLCTCVPYPGAPVCPCPSCGPSSERESSEQGKNPLLNSRSLIDAWAWAPQPSVDQLKMCLRTLVGEQHQLSLEAASSTLSSMRLKQQLAVATRYYAALVRHKRPVVSQLHSPSLHSNLQSPDIRGSKTPSEQPMQALARVGSRAALSFAFAFLKRAWRSGEDSDLCGELLKESLEALRAMPEATLFCEDAVSPVWLEVVERADKFLRSVVLGDINVGVGHSRGCGQVPVPDQQLALSLLLELSLQRGTLSHILSGVLLLLQLWDSGKYEIDNRTVSHGTSVPLVTLLRRFESMSSFRQRPLESSMVDDDGMPVVNSTECFLSLLTLPEDEGLSVDLQQCAMVIMCHLDRLASPYLPQPSRASFGHNSTQEVMAWSLAAWEGIEPMPLIDLGDLRIIQICCSKASIGVLTSSGKVFALQQDNCGLRELGGFDNQEIVKLASHPLGEHFLALSANGDVFYWSDRTCFVHDDETIPKEAPALIQALSGNGVKGIYCGSQQCAAVTAGGQLYTWDKGSHNSQVHGKEADRRVPALVTLLGGHKVVDVACGNGDFGTPYLLVVTDAGLVFSLEHGDEEKSKQGGLQDPRTSLQLVDTLQGAEISRVFCWGQFNLALSRVGTLYVWGGGKQQDPSNQAKVVRGMEGRRVVDISFGASHCVALTHDGQVYMWTNSDWSSASHLPTLEVKPFPGTLPAGKSVAGVSCSNLQLYVWSAVDNGISLRMREPLVVDVCPTTMEQIDELLTWACEGTDVAWPPPPQEKECIAVAALNILRLQVHAAISNGAGAEQLGLVPDSRLLNSLKQRVVALASGPNVLPTIQRAAQQTLQASWSFLLPTADERARALSVLLLSSGSQASDTNQTSGRRFMMDLLVGSLMAYGGLESSLQTAIKVEIQDIDDTREKETASGKQLSKEMTSSGEQLMSDQALLESETKRTQVASEDASSAIPLLHLVKQLLRYVLSWLCYI